MSVINKEINHGTEIGI